MKKRFLKQLILSSYKQNKLDPNIVSKISSLLNASDLKGYIRGLKLMEQKKRVYIALPNSNLYNSAKRDLAGVFPSKDIIFREDPNLLLGIQIRDGDTVYEMNLKNSLDDIMDEIDQKYE